MKAKLITNGVYYLALWVLGLLMLFLFDQTQGDAAWSGRHYATHSSRPAAVHELHLAERAAAGGVSLDGLAADGGNR
jgi:hypothetical protein